jgi:N-acetylglucosaminyl-diphospho-decaprenol L-rhamnosyltransferase
VAEVCVGIVSWNTAGLLDRCLAALPAALDGLDARVVVVDNDSSDGSAEMAARHLGVTVIRNSANVGYARAMNQALAGTDAPVLIALNPDTEPDPGSLGLLVDRLLADPTVGLVTPRLLNSDGTEQHSVYRFPSPSVAAAVGFLPRRWQRGAAGRRFWLEGFADHGRTTDIDWAMGAVHVIRSAALDGQPPYSERWFMYVEDLDFCWWLDQRGWRRRLEADVAVRHVGNASGVQAWGDARTARWLEATYDWYRLAKGRLAMTAWAIVNVAALVTLVARLLTVSSVRPDGRALARAQARQFLRVLPQHLRILVCGPRIVTDRPGPMGSR